MNALVNQVRDLLGEAAVHYRTEAIAAEVFFVHGARDVSQVDPWDLNQIIDLAVRPYHSSLIPA